MEEVIAGIAGHVILSSPSEGFLPGTVLMGHVLLQILLLVLFLLFQDTSDALCILVSNFPLQFSGGVNILA